jgi:hypothetical protein
MATVVKDFKIKSGLIVEGTTGKINNFDILTKKQDDVDYIVGLIGGTATPDNTPDTVVKRDGTGSFAAQTVTVETLNVSGIGTISDDDELLIAASEGEDIRLTADDVRVDAVDDFRVNVGGDVLLATTGVGNNVYVGSIDPGNEVVVEATLDAHIGDATVDGTAGNTVYDRIFNAKAEAIADANSYTDTAVQGAIGDIPTSTDELTEGTTNLYYTDTRARDSVSAGDGLGYNNLTGVFSADLGNGLQISVAGQIEIDDSVVATDSDVATAVSDHSNLTSGVHGVTGDVVGTSDVQTLTNKALGSGTTLGASVDAEGFTVTNLAEPVNASDAATKGYVDAVAEGLHVHASAVAATTGNVDLATGGLLTVDGVTLVAGDRVLVKSQTDSAENGIYVAAAGAWSRAADYNSSAEVQGGDFTFVTGGTLYASTGWVQVNTVTTLGTDPIEFDQFSGAGEYSAGNGLTLTGTEFAIDTTVTATKTYVDGEIDAHELITSGIHGVTGDFVGTTDTQTLENKTLGSGSVLGANLDGANTYKVVNLADPTVSQDAATKGYVDGEISTISNTVSNLTTADVAEDSSYLYFTEERAVDAAAGAIVAGDHITVSYDDNAGTITITGENGVADSTTDDLSEGTSNLYFTDERAQDAIATAIAGGTQTNISVTYDDVANTFSFVAENGIADSTTTDLAEGTNLYFTDARAVDALEAVVPNFEAIEIDSVAKQVAATLSAATAGIQSAFAWVATEYRSAEFLVKVAYGTHTEISKVLLTLDTSDNIAITEYGIVGTNGSASSISASVSNGNVSLDVTTTNNNSTVTVVGTLLV